MGFRLNDAPTARRYWLREHVLAHFASLSVAPPAPAPSSRRLARHVQSRTASPDTDALAQIAALRAATAGA